MGSGGEITNLQSVSPYEVDLCKLLWLALAPTGLSRHVCRAVGAKTLAAGCGGTKKTGLEMERLHGDGKAALNLEEFILQAADGGECLEFGNTLRVLIFQALYTLSMCTLAFNGLFRHNDLHARNVCFTPWNSAGVPVTARYELRCFPDAADGMFVDRSFMLASTYRAVIIDYGWAALLPGLGPDFDARFFKVGTAAADDKKIDILATTAAFKDSGMSQQIPCQAYDASLFMYSIYAASLTVLSSSSLNVSAEARHELLAFNTFYDSFYREVPQTSGRLGLSLQRHLLRSRTVPGGSCVVPTTEQLLRAPYFAAFRCETAPRDHELHRFGCNASESVLDSQELQPALASELQCYLAGGKKAWEAGSPPTGGFAGLLKQVMGNIQRWKTGTAVRKMETAEEEAWVSLVSDSVSSLPLPSPLCQQLESPCSSLHFPPSKKICVNSPSPCF